MGVPVISQTNSSPIQLNEGEQILDVMKFTDATSGAGLNLFESNVLSSEDFYISSFSVGDMDGDGDQDIYYSGFDTANSKPFYFLLQSEFGRFKNVTSNSGILHAGVDNSSALVDYDNDGFLDLFICNSATNSLYRNVSQGVFENVTTESEIKGTGNKPLFVDIDHEGDLDLVIANSGANSLFINNGDGSFSQTKNNNELVNKII